MDNIIVYGTPTSRASRVLWASRELGLDLALHPVDLARGEQHHAHFVAINPMAQIPALEENGFVLAESLAINYYLARSAGGELAPQGPREEAVTFQWSLWVTSAIEPHLLHFIAQHSGLPRESRSPARGAAVREALRKPLASLDAHLAARGPFVAGARFTIADVNVAGPLAPVVAGGIDLSDTPALRSWAEACYDRPAAAGLRQALVFPPPVVARYLADFGHDETGAAASGDAPADRA